MRYTYSKKNSLPVRFIALLLCAVMLLGTTPAWVTASAADSDDSAASSDSDGNWVNILPEGATLDFESGALEPLTVNTGTLSVVSAESIGTGRGNYVLKLETSARAQYSNTALSQTAGGSYKIIGWFKTEKADTQATITYCTRWRLRIKMQHLQCT